MQRVRSVSDPLKLERRFKDRGNKTNDYVKLSFQCFIFILCRESMPRCTDYLEDFYDEFKA